jgi:hypothetical protein
MVGIPADTSKGEELLKKLDENSDGEISQEEFINIIKQDHELLNVLKKRSWTNDWKLLGNYIEEDTSVPDEMYYHTVLTIYQEK